MLRRTVLAGLTLTLLGACSSGGGSKSASAPTTGSGQQDLVEVLASTGQCKTFLQLVRDANYIGKLHGKGPFTLLVPNEAAFEQLIEGPAKSLSKLPAGDGARRLLDHHIVAGLVQMGDLTRTRPLRAIDGQELDARRKGSTIEIENAELVRGNIAASNGFVHIIGKVMGSPGAYRS